MAEWDHRCCERCWFDGAERLERRDDQIPDWEIIRTDPIQGDLDGAYRHPSQVKDADPGACCVCGGMTITGIFFRRDQDELLCAGRHEDLGSWSRVSVEPA